MRSFTKVPLGVITAIVMATSTFPIIVASVLAPQLIDQFGITRAQVGLLATASGMVGALSSPFLGRLTDRIGALKSVGLTLLMGVVALALLAISPSYPLLFAAALLTGIPNGWGNPSTNALIVENLEPGSRGVITGVKQSGVQMGTFLAGLLLPLFAVTWGWRVAIAAFIFMPAAGLAGLWGRDSAGSGRSGSTEPIGGGSLPSVVRRIAVYGFISGMATSAIIQFIPLFANEDQGWSTTAAGGIIAALGFAGIVSRIFWSRWSERRGSHGSTLRLLSLLTAVSGLLLALAAADMAPPAVLIPAAALTGLGAVAWNAVGMLAVMELAPPRLVGQGTGVVLFGFLFGLALGAPLMGWSVDVTGGYVPGWSVTMALLFVSALIASGIPDRGSLANP